MIVINNITKKYVKSSKHKRKLQKTVFNAVDNVSFSIKNGQTIGILGPNGAGKTTLLRIIAGVMEPSEGTVNIIDKNKKIINDYREKKKIIAFLSDNTKLYNKLTVREMLMLIGEIYDYSKKDSIKRIEEITDILDLNDFIDNKIDTLSTGQTQRANLSRCFFYDPEIYILDEPTLGLDIISTKAILDFMKKEQKKGKTIIYSTHYVEEAELLCNKILLMKNGKIIIYDTPKKICKKAKRKSIRNSFYYLINEE